MEGPSTAVRVTVTGIPSVSFEGDKLVFGSLNSSSTRSYTPLKTLVDGSLVTLHLCDWHAPLPPNAPLSAMQSGAGARPEWEGKRLVAVKQMKGQRENGWNEHNTPRELEVLQAILPHPNIVPLYDAFLVGGAMETLYFVLEPMEGDLYQLMKVRKGRALAGGLVASIFQQIVAGLDHIHSSGYFHCNMIPENILVTTTGHFNYIPASPLALPDAPKERDIMCIIRLTGFSRARETAGTPSYTEYVSFRWYQAPEALLLSRDYSTPVDMWALGVIMAELLNLRPLFPGSDQIDQLYRIYEILGDPRVTHDVIQQNGSTGGGSWPSGIRMAETIGFQFPKMEPKNIHSLFNENVSPSLVDCIRNLLLYDPGARHTSQQCLAHSCLSDLIPQNSAEIPT